MKKISINELKDLVLEVLEEELDYMLKEAHQCTEECSPGCKEMNETSSPSDNMREEKWMQKAVHPSKKGEFTAKANAAGMSVQQYADHVLAKDSKASKETKAQAKFTKSAKSVSKK